MKTLGFGDKEIKLYLLILKHKKISAADLAKLSHINRATVYAISKSLIAKGVVTEDIGGKSLTLSPTTPEELQKLLRKNEKEMKEREKATNAIIEELSLSQVGVEYFTPKIRFIENDAIEDFLRDNLKRPCCTNLTLIYGILSMKTQPALTSHKHEIKNKTGYQEKTSQEKLSYPQLARIQCRSGTARLFGSVAAR